MTDDQIEAADEAGEQLEQASDSASKTLKWYARAFLTIFFGIIIAGIGLSVSFGYLTPDITFVATVNIGYIVEYVVIALAAILVFFVASLVLIALPGEFMSGIVSATARIADAYQLPTEGER
jgi:hypothetical protein